MNRQLKSALQSELKEYRGIPFWSWNNYLDEQELCKQIEDMKEAGLGGFIMHARTGLKDEYLGEKWFSCIEACLKKARELDMEAWVYFEIFWPSVFVGGKLLEREDFRARFLEYQVGDFDEEAFGNYIEDSEAGYKRVEAPVEGVAAYHKVILMVSPGNTDILNPEVTEAFLRETHDQYYARFSEYFGKELAGFFTDEPQYYRASTPYTPMVEPLFAAQGEEVRDGLIWLFVKDQRGYAFRQKYYGWLNELYTENFYHKLYDWCTEHNCKLTGHSVEEDELSTQMWGGAAVMPSYEYEHIPGIDHLHRFSHNELASRQVASVAAQMGHKRILTETFACCGNDVKPLELKAIGESMYFYGVNQLCHHLYPYSIADQGRWDHPPVFGPHSNWQPEFKAFNDYFAKLGYIVTNTEEVTDIAIIHPIREIWLDFIRPINLQSTADLEAKFRNLLARFRAQGIGYHLIDERILARHGRLENGRLVVGNCSYGTVVIPDMRTLTNSTYELLKQYSGKLAMAGKISYLEGKPATVELKGNITLNRILKKPVLGFQVTEGDIRMVHRKGDIGEFVLLRNNDLHKAGQATFTKLEGAFAQLDLQTLKETPAQNTYTLAPCESKIFIKKKMAAAAEPNWEEKDLTADFAVTKISPNYLVLDEARISRENEKFSEMLPIPCHFDTLLREDYKGLLTVRQEFVLKNKMALKLIMEKTDFVSVTLNGKDLTFTKNAMDVNYIEADISKAAKRGKNILEYSFRYFQHEGVHFALFDPLATESLVNGLYFDTNIQNTYVEGNFVVNEDGSLSKRTKLPRLGESLTTQGYPNFKGEITIQGKVLYSGAGPAILDLQGRYLVGNLRINRKKTDLVLETEKDISRLLKKGENTVTITLKSSMHNFWGPLHRKSPEDDYGPAPFDFHFRKTWSKEGTSWAYCPEQMLTPFGLTKIAIRQEKEA